ncbi:MAG: cobalamin-binding protein [Gammaproteobacteria bacterium]|nr:cobalamin-binding protein [Gammaproteobacteria bacterium]MDP2142346.1 cobalamin-binding protein [Gammaproteobacteria bacterium]MDP2348587.1 cobalamin-binding protein [Gammaproteobacteria bacterium]
MLLTRLIFTAALVCSTFVAAQPITVTDDDRRSITLEQPAQRIISLAPSLTELLFAAGAGDQVVGVSEYSDYPPEAATRSIVGRYDLLNMEAIVALGPDLIVAWRSGNPRAGVQRLIDLGFNVYVAEPTTLASIADHIDSFALLAGTQQTGGATSRFFRERLNALSAEFQNREPVSVFYQVWNEPLISVGGNELINDIITLCGGSNIFADLGLAPKVSEEAVLQRNPQVIIASGMDISRPEWLDEWLRWPQLQAVANGDLYFIPPDLVQRHSLRVLSGAEQMCNHIGKVRVTGR